MAQAKPSGRGDHARPAHAHPQSCPVPHIVIQVIGYDAAPHPATGPFTTLSFGDGTRDVLHEDGLAHGHLTADPTTVRDAHHIYDLLRAAALPPAHPSS